MQSWQLDLSRAHAMQCATRGALVNVPAVLPMKRLVVASAAGAARGAPADRATRRADNYSLSTHFQPRANLLLQLLRKHITLTALDQDDDEVRGIPASHARRAASTLVMGYGRCLALFRPKV